MKFFVCLLLLLSASASIFAQSFKKGDAVEIDQLMSSSRQGTWEKGTITNFDKAGLTYTVKLKNGMAIVVPSRNPEQWIRAASTNPADTVKTKPEIKITSTTSCAPTEQNVKQRIKEQVALTFANYEKQTINHTFFKKEGAYKNTDPYFGRVNTLVQPFKIEFTVDLVHQYKQGGQDYTEHKIWKFKRKYILYTNTKGECEFGITEGTAGEMTLNETY
jgi:hypothetical protein